VFTNPSGETAVIGPSSSTTEWTHIPTVIASTFALGEDLRGRRWSVVVHAEQTTLRFNMLNIGVRLCSLLCFIFKIAGITHDKPSKNEGHNDE
jgi:hypothetical protein